MRIRVFDHRVKLDELIGSEDGANLIARLHPDRIVLGIVCLKLRSRVAENGIQLLLLFGR
jgi:hypothetical protein